MSVILSKSHDSFGAVAHSPPLPDQDEFSHGWRCTTETLLNRLKAALNRLKSNYAVFAQNWLM